MKKLWKEGGGGGGKWESERKGRGRVGESFMGLLILIIYPRKPKR